MVKTVLVFLSFILLVSLFLNSNITGFTASYDQQLIQGVDVADEEQPQKMDLTVVREALVTKDAKIIISRQNNELYFMGVPTKKDIDKIFLDVEGNAVVLLKEKNFKDHFELASKSCVQEKKDQVMIPANPSTPFTGYATKWSESEKFNSVLKTCQDAMGGYGIEKLSGLEKADACRRKLNKALECQEALHEFNDAYLTEEDLQKIPLMGHDDLGETSALDCYCKEKLKYLDDKLSKETDLIEKNKLWQERDEVVGWCHMTWLSGSFDECRAPLLGRGELGAKEALKNECKEKLANFDEKLSKETNLEKRAELFKERMKFVGYCYEKWHSGAYDINDEDFPVLGKDNYGEEKAVTSYCKEQLSQLEELNTLISHEYDPKHKEELIEKRNKIISLCEDWYEFLPEELKEELSSLTGKQEICPSGKNVLIVNNPSNEVKISSGDSSILISPSSKAQKKPSKYEDLFKKECPKKRKEITPKKKAWEDGGIVPPKLDVPWDQGKTYVTPQPSTKMVPFSCGDHAYAFINNQMVRSGEVPEGYRIKCQCDQGFKGTYPNCEPDCGPYAQGVLKGNTMECSCLQGYKLEGNRCVSALSPQEDCVQVGGSFDPSSGKCLLCPPGTTFQNGKCACEPGFILSGNKCVPACDLPKFFDQTGQCTSCQEFCQNKGMTTQQTDNTAYIKNYLNQNGVCKTNADIRGGGSISVTGTNCQCFDPNPPQISISGDAICQQTPCGPVACNTGKSCSCGQGCTMTVTCNWGGWNYIPGRGAVPILQPGTSQQQSPQQDIQVPSDYQGGYGGGLT